MIHQEWGTRGQATKKPPLPLEGMNPQVNQLYTHFQPYHLFDWDYGIDNTERWYAKTALDWHYAAGGLHPMDYHNRLSAIMVATMWSHLVAVFADLPAPGPAYDGGQLFKACQRAQKTSYTPFIVGFIFLLIVCLPFISLVLMSDDLTRITILLALISIMTIVAEVTSRIARCNFIKQLNLQQREFLHAAEQVRAIRLCSQRQQQLNNINS